MMTISISLSTSCYWPFVQKEKYGLYNFIDAKHILYTLQKKKKLFIYYTYIGLYIEHYICYFETIVIVILYK